MRMPIRHIIASFFLILTVHVAISQQVTVGAGRPDLYIMLLEGKRVGLLSNQTGVVDGRHTLDLLLENGINVTTLFSPEHGFRGTADAGERISDSIDAKTGLPIISLYGKKQKPLTEMLKNVDVVVADLQDVGLRFYTYYITMLRMMEAAADSGKSFVVFDRPNPNGMYIDGPILDMSLASGVGQLPIPVVHGMTMGELAQMIVGENWLRSKQQLKLDVVPCSGYTHQTRYELPIAPSPNLPDMTAIYLYPSICLFEGTVISLGRGTDMPFTIYGHPSMTGCNFSFTPRSRPGAKNPPMLDKKCYGRDLRGLPHEEIIANGLDLSYIIDAYNNPGLSKSKFFTPFFDKLIGNTAVRRLIESGVSAKGIKATWADDIAGFKLKRKPYLIYPE